MKTRSYLPLLLLSFIGSTSIPLPPAASPAPIQGDYVEARTASVFAGACHYNGELVTEGRDAIMAWNITRGSWKGVDLSGIKAMGAISSDDTLGNEVAERKTELLIDSTATRLQTAAFADLLRTHDAAALGHIISIRNGNISFRHQGSEYEVGAKDFGSLSMLAMPNNECCTQPQLVWYTPLMPLEHRKVGYTISANYEGSTINDPWQRAGENSGFYGSFQLPQQ